MSIKFKSIPVVVLNSLVILAKRFIEDVDAPKGKAFIYYNVMKDAE